MLIRLVINIRKNSVFSRWNLAWNLNILSDLDITLLDRTLHINILDLLAKIRLLIDQTDEAVLDL